MSGLRYLATPARSRPAFTIVEILVVIGIMTVLMGLLLPALSAIKASGRQTVEMSAARQLMLAYLNYANHYNDRVLPGYQDPDPDVMVRDASGRRLGYDILSSGLPADWVRARYPWRIAPFLSYNFRGMYANEQQELLDQYEQEDPDLYTYMVSLFPSLGLNSRWIGGDADDEAFDQGFLDAFGRYYVVSMHQVRFTDRLMVFGSARNLDNFDQSSMYELREGHFRIVSPYRKEGEGYMWTAESFHVGDEPQAYGYISPRYLGEAVVAYVDGHTNALQPEKFQDMRLWANDADRADWELAPRR